MYAVAEIAGKQYILEQGKTVAVDRLDAPEGASINIDKICMIRADDGQVRLGQPYLEGAVVHAKLAREFRARKVLVFFYRKRKDSKKKRGHRQYHSMLQIESIEG
ncbi:MAG: 50S ribosomal protein L21 [Spirochaetota bacterium]|jgi:large subunit ribosomal protein L21|nr:50S ribosomal protein L21 [Spirochaetota bacterium]